MRSVVRAACAACLLSSVSRAQLSPAHALQAFGLKAGTQAPPGVWIAPTAFSWNIDNIANANRDKRPIDLTISSRSLFGWFVTNHKILGANYGFMFVLPWVSNAVELPRLGFDKSSPYGFADAYVQPINLGWHFNRADYMAGLAAYVPTGRYEIGGSDNKGFGMFSFELSGGTTFYFDKQQHVHISALGFYETHTKKRDQDLRVGDVFTVEGGLGATFLKDKLTTGIAYGGQWKLVEDSGNDFPDRAMPHKQWIYTVGPEATATVFQRGLYTASLTLRYVWDRGARSTFEGTRAMTFVTIGRVHLTPAQLAAAKAAAAARLKGTP